MPNETILGRRLPPVIIRELVVPEPSEVLLGTSLVDLRREHNSQRTKLPFPEPHRMCEVPQQQQDKYSPA